LGSSRKCDAQRFQSPQISPKGRRVTRRASSSSSFHTQKGSTAELETQVILSIELGFAEAKSTKAAFILLDDIRRMLNGLRRKLSGDK
jgi:four helix bundle protein